MRKIRILFTALCLCCLSAFFCLTGAYASPAQKPDQIKAVMVGDRLVDVALKLGVVPEGMAVRLSMWPDKAPALRLATQVLGCPNRVLKKFPKTIPDFMKERGIKRLILEKSVKFCLYKKDVNPVNVADLVKDVPGITIEYVDFSKGIPAAVREAAALFDMQDKADKIIGKYKASMKKVEASLAKGDSASVYSSSTATTPRRRARPSCVSRLRAAIPISIFSGRLDAPTSRAI